jgi:hypothetical protein
VSQPGTVGPAVAAPDTERSCYCSELHEGNTAGLGTTGEDNSAATAVASTADLQGVGGIADRQVLLGEIAGEEAPSQDILERLVGRTVRLYVGAVGSLAASFEAQGTLGHGLQLGTNTLRAPVS